MRSVLLSLVLVGTISAQILAPTKQKGIDLDRQKAKVEASKLATSWINPIQMNYSYQKGDQFPNQLVENFTITIDQPIFKSLGIREAIKYARAKRGESLEGIKIKKKELIATVYKLAFSLKRLKFLQKKQELALKNAKIDVEVKKEAYLSGELDSTFLDNAILKRNAVALQLLDISQQITQTRQQLRDLSDLDENAIKLPHLRLIPKKEYLCRNLVLLQSKKSQEAARHFKNMTIARYLPSISLFYNYNYQKSQGSLFFPGFQYADHFSTYGVRISMPLFDINSFKEIESAKIDYLKAKNILEDKRRQKSNLYWQIQKSLQIINKKIELTKEDIKLYSALLKDTEDRYKAGEKTLYDLETIKNSLEQKRLDLKIFKIDRQLLLLDLYKEVSDAL